MAKGDLLIQVSDMGGKPIRDAVEIEFHPFSGELGAGGDSMEVSFKTGADPDVTVTGITCRGGVGTMYSLTATTPHYRTYGFAQRLKEQVVNTANDDIEFWVKPNHVKDIRAPKFADLPLQLRTILLNADMRKQKLEDSDLVGKTGASLYQTLGPLRKACLLNIGKKASHMTADNCLPFIQGLLVCRQDRFFAFVDSSLPNRVQQSPLYKNVDKSLHDPLTGFKLTGDSFKTRDPHANLQITFMVHVETGRLAADIDIDESSGIRHGLEVIGNAAFNKRTNPYLIREFMLSADLLGHSLDPGYEFAF